MPTPRMHGGAQLLPLPLTTPGFLGLNTQQAGGILGPEWATRLDNSVLDANGRVAARRGWLPSTSAMDAVSGNFIQLFEYLRRNRAVDIIATTDDDIYNGGATGSTFTSIDGTLTITDGNWQFLNFNDLCVGVQQGTNPIVYNGSGNFTEITSTDVPQGGVGLAAFGRLWIVDDDRVTLRYSGLLDHTDWDSVGAGLIDMTNVWPENDVVTALAAYNGRLVVFGENNIIFWTDGQQTALGVEPEALFVEDMYTGAGCIARDSLQQIEGDLWFLSKTGVMSLGRLIQEKSNPVDNLSRNVQGFLQEQINSLANPSRIRSTYSPENRFYLLSIPRGTSTSGADDGAVFCFDTQGRMQDGAVRVGGVWTNLIPTAIYTRRNGDVIMARPTTPGRIGRYSGGLDGEATYEFRYESGWLLIDPEVEPYLKILKRFGTTFFADYNLNLTFRWAFDFAPNFQHATRPFQAGGTGGEWGLGEWGESEFGGSASLRIGKIPASGTGQYIKLGLSAPVNNGNLSIQKLDLYTKIGRIA